MGAAEFEAVLFDLGNTLVSYYKPGDFHPILERCIAAVTSLLQSEGWSVRAGAAFERAKQLDRERHDLRVWPLRERLSEIFAVHAGRLSEDLLEAMSQRFLDPIMETGKSDPQAVATLTKIKALGLKCGIVSNTPWGSPAALWREELRRHGLLGLVDEAVFCVDVGWRKPAPQIFQRALMQLGVRPGRAFFVGDDLRWDVEGAAAAGMVPVWLCEAPPLAAPCRTIQQLGDLIPLIERHGS
jgi:putative hydrolase of the HAD superfamily